MAGVERIWTYPVNSSAEKEVVPFEEALREVELKLQIAAEAHRREVSTMRRRRSKVASRPADLHDSPVSWEVEAKSSTGSMADPPLVERRRSACSTLQQMLPSGRRSVTIVEPTLHFQEVVPTGDVDSECEQPVAVRADSLEKCRLQHAVLKENGCLPIPRPPGCEGAIIQMVEPPGLVEAPPLDEFGSSADDQGLDGAEPSVPRLSALASSDSLTRESCYSSGTESGSNMSSARRSERWGQKESAGLLSVWDIESTGLYAEDGPCFHVETCDSMDKAAHLPSIRDTPPQAGLLLCAVIHPQSIPRLCFDLVALSMMIYDIVMIPVHIAFEPADDYSMDLMEWVTVIFWTLDMILSFNTGYNTSDGSLIMQRQQVMWNYLRTWFGVDVCVLLPELFFVLDRQASSQAAGALKAMRFVRILRLLRIMKVDKILRDLKARINSNSFLLGMAILRHIFCLSLLIHVVACVWYGLGNQAGGWVETHGLSDTSLWHQYLASLHWSLTQFHGSTNINPTTELERLLAVLVLLMALILFSSFLSSITNLMMQLSDLRHERTVHLQALYSFLDDHNISPELSVRVKKYVEAQATLLQKEHDVQFLRLLPKHLMLDLHDEARSPALTHNPFMAQLRETYPRLVRQLCHNAVTQGCFQREDTIFAKGDSAERMYFTEWGTVRYYLGGRPRMRKERPTSGLRGYTFDSLDVPWALMKRAVSRSFSQRVDCMVRGSPSAPDIHTIMEARGQELARGRWLSEAALWTKWEHRGDLEAMCHCSVLMLNVKEFQHCVEAYEVARLESSIYARAFVEALKQSSLLSDLMDFRVSRTSTS